MTELTWHYRAAECSVGAAVFTVPLPGDNVGSHANQNAELVCAFCETFHRQQLKEVVEEEKVPAELFTAGRQ